MTERPSVMHFTTTGAIAGTEQILVNLSDTHDRVNWCVSFATLFAPGEMNRKILQNGAPCYSTGVRSAVDIPLAVARLAILLRRYKVDILHTHLVHAGFVGVLAAALSGRRSLKLVHTRQHADELYRFGPRYKAKVDRFVARRQDVVCALSDAVKDVLVELDGVLPSKVRVSYPGLDLQRLRSKVSDSSGATIRAALGLTSEHLLIASVAHLLPKKGHKYLLRAMSAIVRTLPNAQLVIAGKGPEQTALTLQIAELGLSEHVQLLGYRDDIPDILNASDLVVQPSLEEAFGMSMVEAMALGKPVIASRIGGIPEVVMDGSTGRLVAPGDAEDLAGALSDLLTKPSQRRKMGAAGRQRAETKFDIRRHATDYEDVWTEVLSR